VGTLEELFFEDSKKRGAFWRGFGSLVRKLRNNSSSSRGTYYMSSWDVIHFKCVLILRMDRFPQVSVFLTDGRGWRDWTIHGGL
jgi:hypothetical protein